MTKDEIITKLLEKGIIVKSGKGFKFPETKPKKVKEVKWCKNFPKSYTKLSIKTIYSMFINDIEIPLWSNGSAKYMLKTQTLKSERALKQILIIEFIDYNKLVGSLKKYYSSGPDVYKYGLANLLISSNWNQIYESDEEYNKPQNTSWQ